MDMVEIESIYFNYIQFAVDFDIPCCLYADLSGGNVGIQYSCIQDNQ